MNMDYAENIAVNLTKISVGFQLNSFINCSHG